MRRSILHIILLCLLTLPVTAQDIVTPDTISRPRKDRTLVHIEHANQFHKTAGSDAVRLIGQVHIRHESAHFYCDSAYYNEKRNSFDAYQHVHIRINDSIDMYCTTLSYDGDRRFAEFFDDVRMTDDSTVLETEYMTYDRNEHLACYPHNGVTTRGDKRLVSRRGYYRDDLKEFRFFDDVVVTAPDYRMNTDSLLYNTRIEKMWFQGPTVIVNEDNTMEGRHGYYLTERKLAYFDQDPVIYNETQRLVADSLHYDRLKGFAKAMDHVRMIDTAYKVILDGQYVEVWEKRGWSFATDRPLVTYYDGGDSLYITCDTVFYHFKTELNDEEKIVGRRNVRFYKSDMQGRCDTLTYAMADSTIRMRHLPILWADDAQLTADSIDIKIAKRAIDSVLQYGDAFSISQDSIEGYNQIKGADMASCFVDGKIHHILVTGDAKTITWLREDDGSLIGLNVSSSNNMRILMEGQRITKIKYFKNINETLFPEKDIKEEDRYLEGFHWRDTERPKNKEDLK